MIHLLIFCITLCVSSQVYADTINTASKITTVMIYPGAAMITRSAEINLSTGDHTVFFDGIVPEINDNTLGVKGQGQAEVKIFGAAVKREFMAESTNERVKELQAQIEVLDDQLLAIAEKQKVLKKKQEYLDSLKFKAGEQLPKDIMTKMPAITDIEALEAYLARGYNLVYTAAEELRIKARDLDRQKKALEAKLQEITTNQQNVKRSIGVEVQCAKAGKITLMVSYLVGGVNWSPIYDARVGFEQAEAELALFGNIAQNTGEDWDAVALTISTSRPTIGGRMPDLQPWYVQQVEVYRKQAVTRAMVMEAAAPMGNFSGDDGSLDKANEELQSDASTAYAQTESKGISVVFKITKPVDIKSDGAWHRVPITAMRLPILLEYATTPKYNTYAYLKSEVMNMQDAVLLPGAVNVYLDNDYVGSSAIDKAIGGKEKFDLYLGVDEGVTVKRKLLEQKSDDTLIGGIPSPNRIISFSYKITVENYKSKSIEVKVYDQIPVAQDDKIKIKNVKFNPEPTKKDVDDRPGIIRWGLSLKPGEKKDILIGYSVEYPRNLVISGL